MARVAGGNDEAKEVGGEQRKDTSRAKWGLKSAVCITHNAEHVMKMSYKEFPYRMTGPANLCIARDHKGLGVSVNPEDRREELCPSYRRERVASWASLRNG
jgi:hypothetical protein